MFPWDYFRLIGLQRNIFKIFNTFTTTCSASMIRNLFYPDRNWNLKSRNLAEKKFDYKCLLSRNIHEENCLKSENIGDIASSYDFRSQVDSSAVFDAQYESHGSWGLIRQFV